MPCVRCEHEDVTTNVQGVIFDVSPTDKEFCVGIIPRPQVRSGNRLDETSIARELVSQSKAVIFSYLGWIESGEHNAIRDVSDG